VEWKNKSLVGCVAEAVGIIRKKDKNIIVIIEDKIYFVTVAALKAVMDGEREITSLFAYSD